MCDVPMLQATVKERAYSGFYRVICY